MKYGMELLINSQTSTVTHTVEVSEWISNFIPHQAYDYSSMLGLKLNHVSKGGPSQSKQNHVDVDIHK